ncbi:E3 ubiquitin-protein ligase TRIM39 isoform X2 [Anolis carolinensis]|uniref:E3 ubiquitin-protein ligase TRIM39 isoform X2 n=1 Tax=Anolis carolinensis TaxID=28377 RepID=UPI002F2B3096
MAATNYATALQEELFCPICLDYFTDPVILNCEHNFCRACISTYWESLGDSFPCPQCRKRCRNGKVRPNAQLGKVAERAKELAARDTALPRMPPVAGNKPEPVQEMCKQHLETLKLFCKDDKSLICVVCDKSKEHRNHTVIPVQEAAEEYKAQFQHHLATLKSERDSREILAINNGKKLEMLVDIGSHLNRYKSWSFPKWTPVSTTELEERISHFSHKKTVLWEHMTAMREILTLDPDSAHPSLVISANRRTASRRDICPTHGNTSKRFYPSFCVLGSEGFAGGRHHWLVDVKGQCGWALGVAKESVDRKKPVVLQPERGIWAVELGPCQLFPTTPASKEETETSTRRILVSLDYERGRLTFSDSQDTKPLFTFRTSFTEKLYPFFWLWSPRASITLCS